RRSSPLRTPVTSPSAAPLSLHDALPISGCAPAWSRRAPHRSQTGTAAPPRSPAQWAGTHTARAAPKQSRSHRTTLLLSYLHTPIFGLYAAKPAVSFIKCVDRRIHVVGLEIRPQNVGKIIFRVGRLPQQEVGRSDLAGRPDDQIRVGHMRGVQVRADGVLGDLLRRKRAAFDLLCDRADRVLDL